MRHPWLHGLVVSGQRPVLLIALVLPGGLRRVVVHVALSRQAGRKVLALQRFRLFRRRTQWFRRGDGPGRPRLSFHHRLPAPRWCRPDRAHRHLAGRLHLGAGGLGRRSARGRHPQLSRRHPRDAVRRMVPGQQAGPHGPAPLRHRPRGAQCRPGLSLPAQLPPAGRPGPPDDHHRTRRPDGTAGPRRQAMAPLGSVCAALVSGQPRDAREPVGLPASDDRVPAEGHVRAASRVSVVSEFSAPPVDDARCAPPARVGQCSWASSPAGAGVCPSSRAVDNRSSAVSAGR